MADSPSTTLPRALRELYPSDLTCACSDEDIATPVAQAEPPSLPGQERAIEALRFGLTLKNRWFNVTVSGAPQSGKTGLVEGMLRAQAAQEPPSPDICICQNFAMPNRPTVLYLGPGEGQALNRFIEHVLSLLDRQIPQLLEQPSVKAHLQDLNTRYTGRSKALTREVEEFAEKLSIVVQTTPQGVNLIHMRNGRPIREEDFLQMDVEEREQLDTQRREVIKRMGEVNPQVMALEKEKRDAIEEFLEDTVRQLVHSHFAPQLEEVKEHEPLFGFLESLEQELVDKRFLFFSEATTSIPFGGAQMQAMREAFSRSCKVNVIVDRQGEASAPVVKEANPTFTNLIGGIDFVEEQGVLKSDFTHIRAGSLMRASGGYLILQAVDLLQQPMAYAALKRALRSAQVEVRDPLTEFGLRSVSHLEPEPVRIETKVVVIGSDELIHMMLAWDDEFARLFKIQADFSRTLLRTPEVTDQLATYLAWHADKNGLLPLEASAIARVVEEASRQVSHQNRLAAQVNELMDVLIQTDALARARKGERITRDDVALALKMRRRRHNKIEEQVKREISEGTILLDFEGAKPGQVNGLAVYQTGRVSFGIPTRITAQAYAGRAGLINVEREANLSGAIHTKGVLILNGYLGHLFARNRPLALSVSITFEQSYGGIDGDSATMAEFFAIISAITGLPLNQSIAVTGSMNQHGEIQPIGGVNEKVTGFFQFAKEHGFPDGCGVIIPYVNRVNLLLDDEIIEAVRTKQFHLYPVKHVEEGLTLMTGVDVGDVQPDGRYPAGTVYAQALERLEAFAAGAEKASEAARSALKEEGK